MSKSIALFGGGGHASGIADILLNLNYKIEVIVDIQLTVGRAIFDNIPVINDDVFYKKYPPGSITVANGIGFIPGTNQRKKIFERVKDIGYSFETIISPSAIVSKYSLLDEGVQILPGAIVQPGVKIGKNSIINTGAIIEHDTIIGDNCHIAPGAVLCGGVTCGDDIFVGANATIIQNVHIGHESVIGSSALVRKNVMPKSIYF